MTEDRITVSPAEAARMLGISRGHFDRNVLPGLAVVRLGKSRLVPVAEIRAWVARESKKGKAGA